MKEETKEKLRRFDQGASKAIRVAGYIVFIPIIAVLLFLLYEHFTTSRSAGDHTGYTFGGTSERD